MYWISEFRFRFRGPCFDSDSSSVSNPKWESDSHPSIFPKSSKPDSQFLIVPRSETSAWEDPNSICCCLSSDNGYMPPYKRLQWVSQKRVFSGVLDSNILIQAQNAEAQACHISSTWLSLKYALISEVSSALVSVSVFTLEVIMLFVTSFHN